MPGALHQISGFRPGPTAAALRLPAWLKKGQRHAESLVGLKRELRSLGLHTVCEAARCPNIHECFHRGTATFLILGGVCTRSCGFCSVPHRARDEGSVPVDPGEPERVARMAAALGLNYVVVTSVTRDDLADGGAEHFAQTVRALRGALESKIEVLTPDFRGDQHAIALVLESEPDVFGHNVETVERLYPQVRPQAHYRRSLEVLRFAAHRRPGLLTKSGLMLGLGETAREVESTLRQLRDAAVDIVTIGQYLRPARAKLPVVEYISPDRFEAYREFGLSLGFKMVFSGPFVRSSYMAEAVYAQAAQPPKVAG